ncbi:MAG: carboxy terminal-processing peptidase [Pseudomonadota bacterium]
MSISLRRPTGWIALSALTVLIIAGTGSTGAPVNASLLPKGALAPLERERPLARRIGTILEESHYRRATIDDHMSEEIFDDYVDSMDVQHSYFLASDIAEFSTYRDRFDDMIHSGDVEPAFVIFARFQQRNRERLAHAMKLLETEPDWAAQESYDFDREKAPWPASTQELDELWRKRVKNDGLSLLLTGKTWPEAVDILHKRYDRVLKRADQVTPSEVFENLMNAYARSFDPHSSYFSARNSEEYRIQMSLSYEGIGATLQSSDDQVSIVNLVSGGPAAVDGNLKINDRITGIAQGKEGAFQEVIGQRLDDVVQLIRGKGGTMVRLQVLPAGAAPGSPEKVIELKRGKVTLEGQASKKARRTVTRNGHTYNIGVITVPGFYQDVQAQSQGDENYRSTTRDVSRLIEELRKEGPVDGLVLDLRGDGGGFLPEATALTGLFIDKGPVVQLKDTTGRIEVLDDPVPGTAYDGPMVVLVDRYSASASEIFAAAIQDYHRGFIVGQRTFGKGTVQNLIPLDRWTQKPVDGQLTVTIGKFYRVTGESTQHRGVEPDIALPSAISLDEVGESSLHDALPWDRIAPARFTPVAPTGAIPTALMLDKEEAVRGKQDPDFQWLVSSIDANENLRQQKSISLNLAKRKLERETVDTQRLARENTRRVALGKAPFKQLEELEAAPDVTGDDAPDILLDRTAQIMADIVADTPKTSGPTVARKGKEPLAVD